MYSTAILSLAAICSRGSCLHELGGLGLARGTFSRTLCSRCFVIGEMISFRQTQISTARLLNKVDLSPATTATQRADTDTTNMVRDQDLCGRAHAAAAASAMSSRRRGFGGRVFVRWFDSL